MDAVMTDRLVLRRFTEADAPALFPMMSDAQGYGYATEAVTAMLLEARRAGYPFVTATHDELNAASGRVMERCGMTYRYSYRECWQPKDIDVVFKLFQIDFARGVPTYSGYWERHPQHWV